MRKSRGVRIAAGPRAESSEGDALQRRLELGCGVNPQPGYLHHDRTWHSVWIDVAHDLDALPWPWDDGTWDEVAAFDVMEHLRVDVQQWLDECHRILAPGGLLRLRLPAWDNALSYRDPTHRRVFHPETFNYWDPESELHRDFGRYYFAESARWWSGTGWRIEEPGAGCGDLRFDLVKR